MIKFIAAVVWIFGAVIIVNGELNLWEPLRQASPYEAMALLASGLALFRTANV